jgi:hypothetical protein
MDSLKLIPQVFFDIIGRVVPGAFAIMAALLLSTATWESWLSATLGKVLADSPTVSVLIFFAGAYVAGQLLSPLAKLVQRVGELHWFRPSPKADGYDWLRTHHPEAGTHCAKIRAEFTMHNGLAAVLLVSTVVYVLRGEAWRWSVLGVLMLGALLALVRGRTTRDTFNETVEKFTKAAASYAPQPPNTAAQPDGQRTDVRRPRG